MYQVSLIFSDDFGKGTNATVRHDQLFFGEKSPGSMVFSLGFWKPLWSVPGLKELGRFDVRSLAENCPTFSTLRNKCFPQPVALTCSHHRHMPRRRSPSEEFLGAWEPPKLRFSGCGIRRDPRTSFIFQLLSNAGVAYPLMLKKCINYWCFILCLFFIPMDNHSL